jgi:hypothetical protein
MARAFGSHFSQIFKYRGLKPDVGKTSDACECFSDEFGAVICAQCVTRFGFCTQCAAFQGKRSIASLPRSFVVCHRCLQWTDQAIQRRYVVFQSDKETILQVTDQYDEISKLPRAWVDPDTNEIVFPSDKEDDEDANTNFVLYAKAENVISSVNLTKELNCFQTRNEAKEEATDWFNLEHVDYLCDFCYANKNDHEACLAHALDQLEKEQNLEIHGEPDSICLTWTKLQDLQTFN